MKSVRLTPFTCVSYDVPKGHLRNEYHFRYGQWTEVSDSFDLGYLLGQDNAILQEETPLGNMVVRCNSERPQAYVRIDAGGIEKVERFQSGQTYTVPLHMFRLLNHRTDFSELPLAAALEQSPSARVLITRSGGLGDVLMSTPAVRSLGEKFPKAQFFFRTNRNHMRVFDNCPFIVQAVEMMDAYNLAPFDILFDLNWFYERHSTQHRVNRPDMAAQKMGLEKCSSYQMHYVVSEEDREWAKSLGLSRPAVSVQISGATWDR